MALLTAATLLSACERPAEVHVDPKPAGPIEPPTDTKAHITQGATASPVPSPASPGSTLADTSAKAEIAAVAPSPGKPTVADPLAPLSEAEQGALHAGPEDASIAVEIHYVQSNETRHDLFSPFIEGRGGAFVGVGSDQSFTMAATAKAELLFLLDIDRRVVDVHSIYAVLIPEAESAAALVDAFSEGRRDATITRLTTAFEDRDEADVRRLLREFRASRETIARHLTRVLHRTVDGVPASWLSDPQRFAHIQALYRAGRVRSMVGDLTGADTMTTIAAALTALESEVSAVYFSNAEEYFSYSPQFIANIAALPAQEDAVVLRTIYAKSWEHADLWAYQVQPLHDLVERLQAGEGRSRNAMLHRAAKAGDVERKAGPKGLSLVAIQPRQ